MGSARSSEAVREWSEGADCATPRSLPPSRLDALPRTLSRARLINMAEFVFNCDPLDESDLEVEGLPLGRNDNLSAKALFVFCFTPESLDTTRLEDVSRLTTFIVSGGIPSGVIAGMDLPR